MAARMSRRRDAKKTLRPMLEELHRLVNGSVADGLKSSQPVHHYRIAQAMAGKQGTEVTLLTVKRHVIEH